MSNCILCSNEIKVDDCHESICNKCSINRGKIQSGSVGTDGVFMKASNIPDPVVELTETVRALDRRVSELETYIETYIETEIADIRYFLQI